MSINVPGFVTHPALDIFPAMDNATFEGLVRDIQEHGQLEPCVIWKGQLLDGRHRILACQRLGIEPDIAEIQLEAGDLLFRGPFCPVEWVIAVNLYRQHLDLNAIKRLREGSL